MNFEYFIAKRLFFGKSKSIISNSIVRISVAAIALGVTVMILAVAIVTGFKNEVRKKVIGFGAHVTIVNYNGNNSFEASPISKNQPFLSQLKVIPGIQHIQVYATKVGVIKTKDEIQGVVLKGIDGDFDWSFFEQNIVEGNPLSFDSTKISNDILISEYIANLLQLKLGDPVFMYFIQRKPKMRRFTVTGIYNTGLEEFDKQIALIDIQQIRKLNKWGDDEIGGFEIIIDDYNELDSKYAEVYSIVANIFDEEGNTLLVQSVKDVNQQIFDWLELSDTNVWVILVIIVIVASFNMVSGLLILILDRTQMIGIVKALGATNWSVRKVFLYNTAFLIFKGMLWGNIIGISLCLLQYHFNLIPLEPSSYYVNTVPINLNWTHVLLLNIGTLAITVLMQIVPSVIITRIVPVKAIRFD